MVIFSVIWSIGTVADTQGRARFDAFFRRLLKGDTATDAVFKDFLIKNPFYDAHFEGPCSFASAFAACSWLTYRLLFVLSAGGGVAATVAAGDDYTHAYDSDDDEEESKSGGSGPSKISDGTPRKAVTGIPDDGTVFDYQMNISRGGWATWQSSMPRYAVPSGAQFQAILVPTVDTVRNAWLIDQLIVNTKHVLCVGDTGLCQRCCRNLCTRMLTD